MTTTITKTIDPFGKGNEAEVVEGIKIETDPLVERVLQDYEELIRMEDWDDIKSKIKETEYPILTPSQIDLTLQIIINEYELSNYEGTTGFLITKLIQKSYNSGNNGFILTTNITSIDDIGYELIGNKENPLQIEIKGNVGYWCGENSSYISLKIEGDVGDECGWDSNNSSFSIGGDVGDCCGWCSTNSAFSIGGDVGDECGWDSENSIFKTPKKQTYKKLLEMVPKESSVELIK